MAEKYLKSIPKNESGVQYSIEECEWIRFNLIETLYAIKYDMAISEFSYAGCRADIFGIANGRGVEFEIKLSRGDLYNDFKKRMTVGGIMPLKHDMLREGKAMVSRFYFVVPEGLLTEKECPDYCGLITFDIHMTSGWLFKVKKQAPMLHKNYISGGTWSTIAKRLALKTRYLTAKYAHNKFMTVRRLGLWQPLR
jgi:hypothetical protein